MRTENQQQTSRLGIFVEVSDITVCTMKTLSFALLFMAFCSVLNYSKSFLFNKVSKNFISRTISWRSFTSIASDNNGIVSQEIDIINDGKPFLEDSNVDSIAENDSIIRTKRVKVRQHVNPLSHQHQLPVKLSDNWLRDAYSNPNLPFIIDVGCAKGGWPLNYSQSHPDVNVLGLEIRRPVVEYCLRRKEFYRLTNVHFLTLNANVDINKIFKDIQRVSSVDMVTIQFPDPHFKAKHKKRRVVNPDFVKNLADNLTSGKKVFIQTDIQELGEDMTLHFSSNAEFLPMDGYNSNTLHLNSNPTNIKTEREVATLNKNQDVYRMLFSRK